MYNDNIYLPVSLGEAIDKLTILDIKLDKIIENDRKLYVKKEYDILYESLKNFLIKYSDLYFTMKKVNLEIWDMMDSLRDGDISCDNYLKICKECIDYNDIRFRVKNKINYVSNSLLKEQKSYKINRLVIIINKNINDNSTLLLNVIKYFSFIYDEINIISDLNVDYLRKNFEYDNTILFKPTVESLLDYKCKVIIEEIEYTENAIYDLFNTSQLELKKIL
jgi:hypothetical protein